MKITHNWRIVQVVEYEVDIWWWKKKTFEKARRAPGVRTIIMNKQKKILLSKEYRYELDASDWRLPWWKVMDTLDEYVEFLKSWKSIDSFVVTAAIREAKEEVGIDILNPKIISRKVCGANMERDLRYVMVTDFAISRWWNELEDGECIEWYERFSFEEIKKMIVTEDIQEGRSAAVLAKIVLS